jgi:hypothetical protein
MVTIGKKTCKECGIEFEAEIIIIEGREMFPVRSCAGCCEKRETATKAEKDAARIEKMTERWHEICPPLYRDTDPMRLPETFRALVGRWAYSETGLGITGEAGKCKTRSAFLILKGQHFAGKRVCAASATKLASWVQNQFSDDSTRKLEAVRGIDAMRGADLILIDDIGKQKMTERVEQEFFDLLEHRTSHCLPTIWTANANAKQLRAMMGGDRGDPIMRRLTEFSEVVSG